MMIELGANISNEISYKGVVTVTLNTQGHKRPFQMYNTGTKHLFDTISRAIAGYDITGSTPRYIDIQYTVSPDVYETALSTRIPFTGIVYGEAAEANSNEGRVLLNATITAEDKQPLNSLSDARLVILDSNRNPLAIIGGSSSARVQELWDAITNSTDAMVEWALIFKGE
jgi:hypothetical protein